MITGKLLPVFTTLALAAFVANQQTLLPPPPPFPTD